MKRYVNYMDAVEAPEGLAESLTELKAEKKTVPLIRWAAAAACLTLILGAGALWHRAQPGAELDDPSVQGEETGRRELDDDLALETDDTHMTTPVGGWYDLTDGETVTRYVLPLLNFQPAGERAALDYTLGDTAREASEEEIEKLLGARWREHLGIPAEAETRSANLFFSKDGDPCGFSLWAAWDGGQISIEQCAGYDVPSCCVSPDDAYGHTEVDGVDVVTLTWDDTCEVKFFTRGTGWKATATGENYQELTARFVRLGVFGHPAGLTSAVPDGGSDAAPSSDGEITSGYDPTK